MTAVVTDIRPQAGKQEAFHASSADIVIYGGAAGGGKTWSLVIEPLRHQHNADFRAVIFRRTSPQITRPGGLLDESQHWYPLFGGYCTQPNSGITWTFPSGAMVRFAHLQREETKFDWQGAQIALLCFDELTHFTETQFFYMLSRNRSTCGVRPYIRATCNPDAGSWVARLIAWWIDQDTGYAIEERSGVIRWFSRIDDTLVWGDSAADLRARYPDMTEDQEPKSLTFIPARLEDNQILVQGDPSYKAGLMLMPLVERERLLGGNWKIMPSGGKVFNKAWFDIVAPGEVPDGGVECRFWDLAATEKKLKGDDPDYTAGVSIRYVNGTYYIIDCIDFREGPTETDKIMLATAKRDRERIRRQGDNTRYMVRWEMEGGASGKRDTRSLVQLFRGFDASGVKPDGDKITRAKALAVQAEQGFAVLVQGEWNERWLTHMHHQPDWDHDDIMDASSGSFNTVVKSDGEEWFATA